MALDFTEPAWAVAPPATDSWTLVEIKGGIEVASHKLEKPCILLGRASNDIALAHESCSRLHARIAFDKSGVPWLRDLNSSHGTLVNKRKLPAAAIGKGESNSTKSGSRGVVLFPGDVLQFGASTRMYCLEGPPEYERGAIRKQAIVKKAPAAASDSVQATSAGNAKEEENQGISWGMVDTDDTAHDSDTATTESKPLDPSMIPEKHRKLFERLTAKQFKLQNVQRESERIRNKGTDLTQGQEAQLRKNDERIQQWEREISEMEQELHKKLNPEKLQTVRSDKRRASQQQDDTEDEDDYDFYDRTKDNHKDFFQDGETQESLVGKWKELLEEWKSCSSSLLTSRQKVDRLEQRLKAAEDQNDEDAFFLQNDLSLAKDSLTKAEERKQAIARSLQETERLLHVVNANLEFDRETGLVGEPGAKLKAPSASMAVDLDDSPSDSAMMPPPVSLSSLLAPRRTMSPAAALPPPIRMPPPLDDMPPPAQMKGDHMPPPKRARILGPAMPPPSSAREIPALAVDEMEMPPPSRAGPNSPRTGPQSPRATPIIGTLSVLAAATKHRRKGPPSPSNKKQPPSETNGTSYDPKKDVWKAPEDQDGSGITKLNAKFAGRY